MAFYCLKVYHLRLPSRTWKKHEPLQYELKGNSGKLEDSTEC